MSIRDVLDVEGLCVYKACGAPPVVSIGVRSAPSVHANQTQDIVHIGQLVAIDLKRTCTGISEGPFLRLTDGSGWVSEAKLDDKKQKVVCLEKVIVEEGLWAFKVRFNPTFCRYI